MLVTSRWQDLAVRPIAEREGALPDGLTTDAVAIPVSLPGIRVVLNILSIWLEHMGTMPSAIT